MRESDRHLVSGKAWIRRDKRGWTRERTRRDVKEGVTEESERLRLSMKAKGKS